MTIVPATNPTRLGLRRPAAAHLTVLLAVLIVVIGPLVWSSSPIAQSADRFADWSLAHPLGTDMYGRDLLARLLHGAHWSLGGALAICLGASAIGFSVGGVAALGPRWLDTLVGRLLEALLAVPTLVVALALSAVLGFSFANLIVALIAVQWPWQARVFRALILKETAAPYVDAAETLGVARVTIVLRHIAPNIAGPAVVVTTAGIGGNILALASMSFLGLGMQPPTPEWGLMINEARMHFQTHPWQMIAPGGAIVATVLLANWAGDRLRDDLDPTGASGKW